jgi:hypothetical protein
LRDYPSLSGAAKLEKKPWFFYASSSHVYAPSNQPIGENGTIGRSTSMARPSWPVNWQPRPALRRPGCRSASAEFLAFITRANSRHFSMQLSAAPKKRWIPANRFRSTAPILFGLSQRRRGGELDPGPGSAQWQGTVNIASGQGIRIQDFLRQQFGAHLEFLPQDDRCDALVSDQRCFGLWASRARHRWWRCWKAASLLADLWPLRKDSRSPRQGDRWLSAGCLPRRADRFAPV